MNVREKATKLHQRASHLGRKGDYAAAIKALDAAHALAPEWPLPIYDKAFTYLLMKKYKQALAFYRETLRLSPRGYFTAITAIHTLEREASGELPADTYTAYMSLEWITDREEKAAKVAQMVERVPTFAPAWKDYAMLCAKDMDERLDAFEKGLAANPDSETKGLILINKAMNLHAKQHSTEAEMILIDLLADPALTQTIESIAREALDSI